MNKHKVLTQTHLSDMSIEQIITNLGLYEPILINTFSSDTVMKQNTKCLKVSSDVKTLYSLFRLEKPLYLPCCKCKKELVFNSFEIISDKHSASKEYPHKNYYNQSITPGSDNYSIFSDYMLIGNDNDSNDYKKVSEVCKKEILDNICFFTVSLKCSLEPSHNIECYFFVEPFVLEDKIINLANDYTKKKILNEINDEPLPEFTPEIEQALILTDLSKYTFIIKKIGQYPSLADMQFYHLAKYKKILKGQYTELTKAIGLNASGIGVGAFVYLRRIFETICETMHKECKQNSDWNETEYITKRFNEKIQYLEEFGKTLLPTELNQIRNKLYGVISKGVHEYSEEECLATFPYALYAIELILDKKLQDIERTKKIQDMTKIISNAKT